MVEQQSHNRHPQHWRSCRKLSKLTQTLHLLLLQWGQTSDKHLNWVKKKKKGSFAILHQPKERKDKTHRAHMNNWVAMHEHNCKKTKRATKCTAVLSAQRKQKNFSYLSNTYNLINNQNIPQLSQQTSSKNIFISNGMVYQTDLIDLGNIFGGGGEDNKFKKSNAPYITPRFYLGPQCAVIIWSQV